MIILVDKVITLTSALKPLSQQNRKYIGFLIFQKVTLDLALFTTFFFDLYVI